MSSFGLAIRYIINLLLFVFWSFIGILFGNFLYGAYLTYIEKVSVPSSNDPVHIRVAIFSVLVVLIFTVLFRKFFYISTETHDEEEVLVVKNTKKKSEFDIYVNKEMK